MRAYIYRLSGAPFPAADVNASLQGNVTCATARHANTAGYRTVSQIQHI